MEKSRVKNSRINTIHNLLFFSLLFSENSILIELKDLFSQFHAPTFALLFLALGKDSGHLGTVVALCSLMS